MSHDADTLARRLGLEPHPEGGFYRETYRAGLELPAPVTGAGGARVAGTAIYYLLTPDTFSEMHRLPFDEVWHHYLGDAVEQLQLDPDGDGRVVRIGTDLAAGERPQVLVPGGTWQGSRLTAASGHGFALLGCTLAPGFDFADYEAGEREALSAAYPRHRGRIAELTRR